MMKSMQAKPQRIVSVQSGSVAHKMGVRAGDALLSVGPEPVLDVIDYAFLCDAPSLTLRLQDKNGALRTVKIRKDETQPLGLQFESGLMSEQRRCCNQCVFCFEEQLPKCARSSLRSKDDDWRLSLTMGNFVTLTNVDERELERIGKRRASPLYISVHASDPRLRERLMGNPNAGKILEQLRALANAGVSFHTQVVLCPGINDGAALEQTLSDLWALRPHALSCALVPVGLTQHREGLSHLTPYDAEMARALLQSVDTMQKRYLAHGTRFVFAADEFYVLADMPVPPDDAYEGYWQIEDGVGLMRRLQTEFESALEDTRIGSGELTLVTGELAAGWMRKLLAPLRALGLRADVVAAQNRFFGGGVSVAGLLTGGDIVRALEGRPPGRAVLLPRTVLRHEGDRLLDDMTPEALQRAVSAPIHWVDVDGYALAEAISRGGPVAARV